MMRMTGFLAGICLTVAAFLLVLDTGELQRPGTAVETITDPTPEELSAIVTAIAEQVDVVPAESEYVTSEAEAQNNAVKATRDGTPEVPSGIPAAVVAQADVVQAGHASRIPAPPDPAVATVDDQLQDRFEASSIELEKLSMNSNDTGTYLFWSPFRSTWAAQGFAGRLTLATRVPVDVVNTGPGKYRVAFSFQDETERLARIERIETITGLKLE